MFEGSLLEYLIVLRLEEELESDLLALGIDRGGRVDGEIRIPIDPICRDGDIS